MFVAQERSFTDDEVRGYLPKLVETGRRDATIGPADGEYLHDLVLRLKAKRAVEAMVEIGEATMSLSMVDSIEALVADLRRAGVAARRVASSPVNVKAIRTGLGLSQEQFAPRFGLDVDAVQNWEQGPCQPDRPAQAYLRANAAAPREVAAAQEEEVA